MARTLLMLVMAQGMVPTLAGAQDRWKDIHCGRLLDVETEETLFDQHILVKNDLIAEIGPRVAAPSSAVGIDLSDQTCMPGLMDMHVHLFIDLTGMTGDQVVPTQSSAYNALMGLRNAQALLDQGFTTLRIPGDVDYQYAAIELRNAINRGEFRGPRMLVSPHMYSQLGGAADLNTYAPDLPYEVLGQIADGTDEIRRAVRKDIKYGADWIKVYATGSVMGQNDDPTIAGYSAEELEVFAEETHRNKKRITAHAHGDAGIRAAVEAGFDSIEHGTLMEVETARLMAAKGTWYVPTLYVTEWIVETGLQGGVSANNLEKARRVAQQHGRAVETAYEQGVRMALGSDPIFPMDQAIREFGAMARRIPDNWYVLKAGTIHGAELLGLEGEIGSLTVGKQADIVAAPASPIDDISNIEDITFVMKGGEVVRRGRVRGVSGVDGPPAGRPTPSDPDL